MPIEDITPAIIHSAKVLVRTTGIGASLGMSSPSNIKINNYTEPCLVIIVDYLGLQRNVSAMLYLHVSLNFPNYKP